MPCCPALGLLCIEYWVCRYIVDPQSEEGLLPTKGTEADIHQGKYKISSHVQAILKQFAQWRSENQFESVGPWQLLKGLNSKLEVQCNQSDMTGHSMFQAMCILTPNPPVASVSCALPSPKSLVMSTAPAKPPSLSGATVPSSKSKATDKSKSDEKVLCSYCGKMFGKQGIRNHIAKCAEQAGGGKGWEQHKYQPISDDKYFNNDDFDLFNSAYKRSTTQPPPSVSLSAAGGDAPKTREQLRVAALKENKVLKKQQQKALKQQAKPVSPVTATLAAAAAAAAILALRRTRRASKRRRVGRARQSCVPRQSQQQQQQQQQQKQQKQKQRQQQANGRRRTRRRRRRRRRRRSRTKKAAATMTAATAAMAAATALPVAATTMAITGGRSNAGSRCRPQIPQMMSAIPQAEERIHNRRSAQLVHRIAHRPNDIRRAGEGQPEDVRTGAHSFA